MSARTAVLLALIFLLPATFRRDLWSPDEPRHAEVARSMLVSGEYVVPHLAGDLYPDKPPPPFWLMAGSMKLFGTVEWAARLPFVLAAAGTLALTFLLARLLGMGVAAAGLAVLMLCSAYRFLWLGQRVSLDVLVTFGTTLAILGWLRQWQAAGRDFWNGLLFFGGITIAVAVKGPIGLLVPLFTAVAHGAWTRRLARLGRAGFLAPVVLFLGVTAAWLVPACTAGGEEYTRELLFKQSAGRVFHAWNHEQSPWYYLGRLPVEFMPWSPVLILAFVLAARRLLPGERDSNRFLLAWFLPTFVFLSIVQSKRGNYLLPLYPALALLSAHVAVEAVSRARVLRAIAVGLSVLLALCGVALAIGPFLPKTRELGLEGILPGAAGMAVLLLAGAVVAFRALKRHPPWRAFAIQALAVLAIAPVAGLVALPEFDAVKSPRALAETLAREANDAHQYVPFLSVRTEEYSFYSGLDCREVEQPEFLEALARPDVALAVLDGDAIRKVESAWPAGTRIIAEQTVGGGEDVIIVRIPKTPGGEWPR